MNRNELNDLIDRFHNSLINLHESAFLSLDFSKNNKLQRNDSLKTFSQHSQIVLLIKLNKLIAMKTRKNYKKILLIQGSIISDEKQYEFRQFKIFFTAFIDFLQKNLVVDKFYLISDLRPKLLKREDIGKIKELVFKSTKTTKVYQTEEKIYKMNFIEKIDKNLKADVKNKEINQNLIEIDMINEEFKDNELKIIDSNKQNLDEIKLKDQNSRDILEFNVSNLLINQGTNQFLIYQENLTRIKEANIDFIHGTIIKILPKNILDENLEKTLSKESLMLLLTLENLIDTVKIYLENPKKVVCILKEGDFVKIKQLKQKITSKAEIIFIVNISNLTIVNHVDLTIFYKECEMNLRQLAICSISTSIPKDKIYRRRLKFLVKFIQMIFISFDVICSICSKKLLNGIDSCPECKRISPSIKSKSICLAQDNTSKVYIELKDIMVYKFFGFRQTEIDTIKTYCFQNGTVIFTRRAIYNKDMLQKTLWPILFHLEFFYIEKIVYGRPYCDFKSIINDKEKEIETIKPKFFNAKNIMININGSIFEKKNEKTFEYIITPCIRVFDIEDIDYLKESKRILKIIH